MIKLILADIDGVLIENGSIESTLSSLKKKINLEREQGKLFSFVSGRDYKFIKTLKKNIFEKPSKKDEAILYEDVGLEIYRKKHVFGGVEENILKELGKIASEDAELFEGLIPLPNNNFQLRYSWVTKEFAQGKNTNKEILEEKFPKIKKFLESKYENIEVKKSADAIDIVGKGCDKIISVKKYLELIEKQNIFPENILVIGDSESDEKMINYILEKGGSAGFVGLDKELEERLKSKGAYIPKNKNIKGTLEVLEHFTS